MGDAHLQGGVTTRAAHAVLMAHQQPAGMAAAKPQFTGADREHGPAPGRHVAAESAPSKGQDQRGSAASC